MLILNFSPFPVLETENLILRQIKIDDVDMLFEIRSNPVAMQFVGRPVAKSIDEVLNLYNTMQGNIEKNEAINWVIQYKNNTKLLGYIGFYRNNVENHRAEIGYTLHPNNFKKGIMNEAIKAVLHYGFTTCNFNTIKADIDPRNEASKNLLLKNRFIKEAYFRENLFMDGKFLDSEIYGLLKSDWEK